MLERVLTLLGDRHRHRVVIGTLGHCLEVIYFLLESGMLVLRQCKWLDAHSCCISDCDFQGALAQVGHLGWINDRCLLEFGQSTQTALCQDVLSLGATPAIEGGPTALSLMVIRFSLVGDLWVRGDTGAPEFAVVLDGVDEGI